MFASLTRPFGTGAGRPGRRPGLRLEALGERAAPAGSVGSSTGLQDSAEAVGDVALCGGGISGGVELLSAKPPGGGGSTQG